MDLNWGPKKPKFKTKNAAPHTFFLFNVIGKLKGQKAKLHQVQIVGFTDGIECGDFWPKFCCCPWGLKMEIQLLKRPVDN